MSLWRCSTRALKISAVRSPVFRSVRFSHVKAIDFGEDSSQVTRNKVTISSLLQLYKSKTPISVITAHDAISGRIADHAGVDMILVGDSLTMVAMGYEDTTEVSLDEMIIYAKAVSRGVNAAFLVADLPFGTYGISAEQSCESAFRMVKEGKVEAVKIEGGKEMAPSVKKLTSLGIPVICHIGLTPQRQSVHGGFKVQGKTAKSAASILEDAAALQEAGCFMFVLEAVPDKIGGLVTDKVKVPVIGIGAGPKTSGQVLVQLDMLGGFDAFQPKFLKRYSNYLQENTRAIKQYISEVKTRSFPALEHCYTMKDEEFKKLNQQLEENKA